MASRRPNTGYASISLKQPTGLHLTDETPVQRVGFARDERCQRSKVDEPVTAELGVQCIPSHRGQRCQQTPGQRLLGRGHQAAIARWRRILRASEIDMYKRQEKSFEGDRLFGVAHARQCDHSTVRTAPRPASRPKAATERPRVVLRTLPRAGSRFIQALPGQITFESASFVVGRVGSPSAPAASA